MRILVLQVSPFYWRHFSVLVFLYQSIPLCVVIIDGVNPRTFVTRVWRTLCWFLRHLPSLWKSLNRCCCLETIINVWKFYCFLTVWRGFWGQFQVRVRLRYGGLSFLSVFHHLKALLWIFKSRVAFLFWFQQEREII